ncbi:MAG: hypothetical protein II273_05465 [Lachnospiraceae bacterium]|nr:hypothetical protein [Lachnospiraceae bacterium]
MEFTSFKTLVRDEVAKRTGEQFHVRINDVTKNNGVVLSGITMLQDDNNISPTIYLNKYYEAYENGDITLRCIVDEVLDTYERNKVNQSVDMRFFMNYERIKDRIIFKLIHAERNKELLKDIPHIRYLDFAVVFQCLISDEMFGNATIMIHNAHLKIWEITENELYEKAIKNTPVLQKYDIKTMKDVLCEMMLLEEMEGKEILNKNEYIEDLQDATPMYVLSNRTRVQGASCILYPNILKDFASAVKSDFYILPSSVHEVILLPAQGDEDKEGLKRMVCEVNETQVEREEVLSDSVYYYSQEKGELSILV